VCRTNTQYKTIADFRKENSKALKRVFREFVILLKELDLITGKVVAVDGAFLRANASKNQLSLKKNLQKDIEAIDNKIESYLTNLEFEDSKEKKDQVFRPATSNKLQKMKERKVKLDEDLALLEKLRSLNKRGS